MFQERNKYTANATAGFNQSEKWSGEEAAMRPGGMRKEVPQVIRFEIYGEDPARALRFYARVFACGEEGEWRIPGVGQVTCGLDGEGRLYGLLREWENRRERENREDVRAAKCAAARA